MSNIRADARTWWRTWSRRTAGEAGQLSILFAQLID
jgi:hypothetical protein